MLRFSLFLCLSLLVTQDCWWFLSQYKTAVYTKWPAATGTTGCPSCAGSILVPKQCCCAQEVSTARAWWDCSSRRTRPRRVCSENDFSFDKHSSCLSGVEAWVFFGLVYELTYYVRYQCCVLSAAPASSSESSSSLEQEKYLQAILDSIPIYFKMNGNNTLSNRSIIGLSPGTFQH